MSYESPITNITDNTIRGVIKAEEGCLLECIGRVGFNIDKEELRKALLYDRGQYEKGYSDGRSARDAEIVRCIDCKHWKRETDVTGIECEPGETAHYCTLDRMIWRSGDFCNYGERRDNEHN